MAEGMYDIFEMSREKVAVMLKERNVAKFVFKVSTARLRAGRDAWALCVARCPSAHRRCCAFFLSFSPPRPVDRRR